MRARCSATLSLRLILAIFCLGNALAADAKDGATRPNILWITSEDNAAHWLGCYGNANAQTPHLDALANNSVMFNHAYSNAPVCAVARSTILHGIYAVSSGTQHMRSRFRIPATFKPYVSYLREQGYYCSNNDKTDFNRLGSDTDIWDASHRKAHYKNRQAEQPFFAIFNLTISHESSLFPENVAKHRKKGDIPQQTRLAADQVDVPPYLPDLPEVRQDFAIYHDYLSALDNQVARILDELDKRGLAEDTIVFYYGDHGGPTPRGKRYLTDTGVRIPMIVHVPEKWKHLSPFQPAEKTDELVAFVDLAPTLLSICGLEKPAQMQGRAFLGTQRIEPAENPIAFLYADRFDEIDGMRRGITDGQFKYLRRFTPHLPAAPCSNYSLSMPSWLAWRQAWRDNRLSPALRLIWEAPQPVEELYDLSADPWEVNNLASAPQQATRLAKYRKRLQQKMLEVRDTGVIPEPLFRELAGDQTISDYARSEAFDLQRVIRLAFLASAGDPANASKLAEMMADKDPVVRYWGTLGCVVLGEAASPLEPQITALQDDSQAGVRMMAAYALTRIGKAEAGKAALQKEFDSSTNPEANILLINLIPRLGCQNNVPDSWVERILQDDQSNEFVRRFAQRIHDAQ